MEGRAIWLEQHHIPQTLEQEILEENCHYALYLGPTLMLMLSFSPFYFLASFVPFSLSLSSNSLLQPWALMYPERSTNIFFILLVWMKGHIPIHSVRSGVGEEEHLRVILESLCDRGPQIYLWTCLLMSEVLILILQSLIHWFSVDYLIIITIQFINYKTL